MQVVMYNTPAETSNSETDKKEERDKKRRLSTPDRRTIYLPFEEFQELMTSKLLKQIREAEDEAIVEGT